MPAASSIADFLQSPWTHKRSILADLDGCILSGTVLLPGAEELFATLSSKLWIVSNNSEDTATTLAARLARLGIDMPEERILLAGEQTLRHFARERPQDRVALYMAQPLRRLACALGLAVTRQDPDVAVLGRYPDFCLADLGELMALAHRGVPVWLTNPDVSHPDPDGTPLPETGALWAAVVAAVPCLPAAMIGKPAPNLVLQALEAAGTLAADAVFLGDNLATDGEASRAAGVAFFQTSISAERRSGATDTAAREARGVVTC